MDTTTLEALEYPALIRELASRAVTPVGTDACLALAPNLPHASIEAAFAEFAEIDEIIKTNGRLPLSGVSDVRPPLARLGPTGAYLMPEDLLLVRGNLRAVCELRAFLPVGEGRVFPLTAAEIGALSDARPLLKELDRVLDDKGGIRDNASPELYRIRKEIRGNRERARSVLEEVSTGKKYKEYLQDDFITIRDDRYCLAIRAEKQSFVEGVIHGRSASSATYFIEPIALVELNNKLAQLKGGEKAEEVEILKAVALLVEAASPALRSDLEIIAALDSVMAKASLATALKARPPLVRPSGAVRLIGARHPLLALKAAETGATVVPVDITPPPGASTLVISGANTGGKTVALKTLGLLTLMTLAGIPIPVEEGSEAVPFQAIFSDIGDRQDIIASLSTFSAHVKRIGEFLSLAGPGSLVLIDEIGSGTDPSEGGAFALAAIERFMSTGASVVVTTHLNLIKAHAQSHPAFMNASVEFDESAMHPLYRLRYGVPGPSLGLSIAEGLGIPAEIIEDARTKVAGGEGAFMESVRLLEKEREDVRELKERLVRQAESRDKALLRLREGRDEIRRKTKEKIEAVAVKAREEMRAVIEAAREAASRAAAVRAVRAIDNIGAKALSTVAPRTRPSGCVPATGDKVAIIGSKSKGTVLRVDETGKKAEVGVGSLKVWTPFDKLEKRGGTEKEKTVDASASTGETVAPSTLNIIGKRAEPALAELQKFMDNAHASGMKTVEIIHGVGTGALSKAVAEFLRGTPYVERFHHGDPDRGGAGVTVVELK
ncbi:MAG: endonuclease MutS2 [Deltaproteobacteria bacterium]|nr:endonuclease MutS2 [Deltaproteobacteria bacterium]